MIIVETHISWGYVKLIETFFKANDLEVSCQERASITQKQPQINLHYDRDSETASQITFMSIKHLGFENMLCDYLIRCDVSPGMIPIGQYREKRDLAQLDKDWEEHRKEIGLEK